MGSPTSEDIRKAKTLTLTVKGPGSEADHSVSTYKTVIAVAKAKNIADLTYATAKKQLKTLKRASDRLKLQLRNTEKKIPSVRASKRVVKRESKSIKLQGKAARARMSALKKMTNADKKVHRKVRKEEKLANHVVSLKARVARVQEQVKRANEGTAKLKMKTKEKKSKADIAKGIDSDAAADQKAYAADSDMLRLAHKLRTVKESQEAAAKKTATVQRTLDVMHRIDAAAQKQASLIRSYKKSEAHSKAQAKVRVGAGADRLKKLKIEMNKLTLPAIP